MSLSVEETITNVSMQVGVPRNTLERLIYNESRGNMNVGWDSAHYSQGIAQVSQPVWNRYANVPWRDAGNPDNYQENIMVAAMYLKDQYNTFHSWPLAMAAYNQGPNAVKQVLAGRRTMSPITQRYISGV